MSTWGVPLHPIEDKYATQITCKAVFIVMQLQKCPGLLNLDIISVLL